MVSITGIYQAYFNAIGRCAEQLGEEIEEVGVAHEDILALLPQLPEQCEEVDVDAVNDRTGEIDLVRTEIRLLRAGAKGPSFLEAYMSLWRTEEHPLAKPTEKAKERVARLRDDTQTTKDVTKIVRAARKARKKKRDLLGSSADKQLEKDETGK